ncbi:uclacyanin 1 [Carica papaya]|uniref:uclacyanin 1 n=1 Tax=Carica papaya TaxID=3649 RepID=UPI000B8CE255|nr:uclacyanin 1 [Carica papaya]
MAMKVRTLTILALTAMLIDLAAATNYVVGGTSGGWAVGTELKSWADSQSFLVGDNLIFQYSPSHDLVEVTKTDFDSCQPTNPIQTYTDGNTAIPLPSPGKRYFICGTPGHCSQGMRLEVETLATATPPPTIPSPASPPESSPSIPLITPVSSLAPQQAEAPTQLQVQSPVNPAAPDDSPSSISSVLDVPSTGANSPFGGDILPPPSPSSANKYEAVIGLSVMMIILLLGL